MRQFSSDLPYTKPESVNFLPGEVERCVDLHANCNIRQLDKATVVAAASQDWSADALKKKLWTTTSRSEGGFSDRRSSHMALVYLTRLGLEMTSTAHSPYTRQLI